MAGRPRGGNRDIKLMNYSETSASSDCYILNVYSCVFYYVTILLTIVLERVLGNITCTHTLRLTSSHYGRSITTDALCFWGQDVLQTET